MWELHFARLGSDADLYFLVFPHYVLPPCLFTQVFALPVFSLCLNRCLNPSMGLTSMGFRMCRKRAETSSPWYFLSWFLVLKHQWAFACAERGLKTRLLQCFISVLIFKCESIQAIPCTQCNEREEKSACRKLYVHK